VTQREQLQLAEPSAEDLQLAAGKLAAPERYVQQIGTGEMRF